MRGVVEVGGGMYRKGRATAASYGIAALIIISLACGGGGAEVSGGDGDGASSATSGAGEDVLIRALKQYANERRQIAITFTNEGYMEYLQNWLWHVRLEPTLMQCFFQRNAANARACSTSASMSIASSFERVSPGPCCSPFTSKSFHFARSISPRSHPISILHRPTLPHPTSSSSSSSSCSSETLEWTTT